MSKRFSDTMIGRRMVISVMSLMAMGLLGTSSASAVTFSSDVPVSFTFNSVISVQLSSADIYINDLAPGDASDSNIITVGANTNASAGFQLSATVGVKNGTSALVNTNDSTYTFTNLSTNKATLANFSDNTWGYSYCANTAANCNGGSGTWVSGSVGSTTAGYNGLPLDNNTNADERGNGGVTLISTTGTEGEQKTVQFKIGAKASNAQASGAYTNTINFYAVANPEPQLEPVACTAGKICYNANSLTAYEGTMGQQTAAADGSTTMLLASNFSRSGYGFAGWSDTYDYSGHKYGPQETITVPTGTTTNGLSLYAIWVKSAGSLQNWSGCSGLASGAVTALTDQRDNQTYAIAKLADGNCWMIENMRLENTNSDNATGTLAQGYNTSFAGLADPEAASLFASAATTNTLYSTDGSTEKTISGSNQGYRFPRYNNVNTPTAATNRPSNPTTNSSTNSTSNAGMYSYGNYYTWSAAIADTTAYTSNNTSVTNTSICPTGWHLPKGGNKSNEANNEFWSLVVTGINNGTNPANYESSTTPYYTGTTEAGPVADKLRSYPNNFVYSGYALSGSVDGRGSYGSYWSSTAFSSNGAYYLDLNSSSVLPGAYNYGKYSGRAVRCVVSGA